MTLWRLEWLRLLRTRRLFAVVGTYVFFGLLGPLTARYLEELLRRFGGGVMLDTPSPTAVDGIVQYTSNAQQIGLLVALATAVGALALDTDLGMSTFLRTRVRPVRRLLAPRYVAVCLAACAAFVSGGLVAWYQTVVLLGPLPAGGMIAGFAFGCLYLFFALAVLAVATTVVRSRSTAVVVAVSCLLALPLLALLPDLRPWLPSHLVGALDSLAAGAAPREFLRAAFVTAVITLALVGAAAWRLERREV